jgi:hypothetical protein
MLSSPLYAIAYIGYSAVLLWLITVVNDKSYIAYKNKRENLLKELETEKQAYVDARKELEATSIMLGNILVEKKENY